MAGGAHYCFYSRKIDYPNQESQMTKDTNSTSEFDLVGIHPALRGVLQNLLTFEIILNEIMRISAQSKGTGKICHLRISKNNGRLKGMTMKEWQLKPKHTRSKMNL